MKEIASEVKDSHRPVAGRRYELFSVPAFATGRPEMRDGESVGSAKLRVRPGDVLLCKINPRINRVWLVPEPAENLDQIASPEYLVLRPSNDSANLGRWLTWYLRSPQFRSWIELNVEGATGSHTRAKSSAIMRQRVPLAPQERRDEIVTLLELQVSRLDELLRAAAAITRKLASYSSSVLVAACDGRLLPSAAPVEEWETRPYGDLVQRITSGSRGWRKYLHRGDGRFVLTQHVKDGYADVAGAAAIDAPPGREAERTRIEQNDILINIVGDVGRTALVRAKVRDSYVSQSVALTRPLSPRDARFLEIFLRSPNHGQSHFRRLQYGVGRGHLLLSHLKEIEVRLPPPNEREAIADVVEQKLSVLDAVGRELQSAASRTERLRRVILAQAFRSPVQHAHVEGI